MNIKKSEIENTLYEILSGKEERVQTRNKFLSEDTFVCQITLNIPGYPKRITNDEKAVINFSRNFIEKWGSVPLREEKISNAAGLCWIALFKGNFADAKNAKEIAVNIEERNPEGRLFDIDIIVLKKTISRSDLGLPPRTCLLCGSPAKECARNRSHSYEELRKVIYKLIKNI